MPLSGCRNDTPVSSSSDPNDTATVRPPALSPTISPESSPSITPEVQTTPDVPMPEPDKANPPSIMDIGEVIYAKDLGIDGIGGSYLYWVPGKNAVIFEGYLKDAEGKFTPGVYYYNNESKEIATILMGSLDSHYYLAEPIWSADNSEVLISFGGIYIYDLHQSSLELLPISGRQAELSPDGSKIIYVDKNQNLQIYNRSNKEIQSLRSDIKGHSPIWFSDNRHILFYKDVGKNPHNLDGNDLHVLCLLDTYNSEIVRTIGEEMVYRDLFWALQDSIAWIYSGWDDGHFFSILDLSDDTIEELGETYDSLYFPGREPQLIKKIKTSQWNVSNIQQTLYSDYTSCPEQGVPIGLLPDETLLFWQTGVAQFSTLLAVPPYEEASIITHDDRYLYPVVSNYGSRFAFIDSNEDFIIFTDAWKLLELTIEKAEVPQSEAEYMNSLIQAINEENIDELAGSCYSIYGTLQPEELQSLPLGLKYFKLHFNNEKIVDYVWVKTEKGISNNSPYIERSKYYLISESGIWREVEIRRTQEGQDWKYQFNEQIFNFGASINKRALEWFDIIKNATVPSLYDYFSWLSEGDILPYSEGTDPLVLERVNRALNRYNKAFKPDSIEIKFTGFSVNKYDNLYMSYEISGFSLDGIPLKHRVNGIYSFPECGVYDLWLK